MRDGRPVIVPVDIETEILFQRVCEQVEAGLGAVRQDLPVGEVAGTVAGLAATVVLRALRVMSARQLAVLLAEPANRHEQHVIREPPPYTGTEIADVAKVTIVQDRIEES
jgi:hypothetical protein